MKVHELRELLERAHDNDEIVVKDAGGSMLDIRKATYGGYDKGGYYMGGIFIHLLDDKPTPKVCPECKEAWEDDDDY